MRRLYPMLARLAASAVPVVIEGETGTGKELVAEALHEMGPRADGPFIVFDCTAVPPNLLESALFGHERGSFTGAVQQKKGVFELAHGGTLFIDEIGDLDSALQPKLLRALERSEVSRVGSSRWEKVDVRVIAATRRDLDREVQLGRFRDDLFYRLAITRIELPPLRRRSGDVAFLARHFWRELDGAKQPLPIALFQRYEEYPWPGNIRELRNAIARRLALGDMVDTPGLAPPSRAAPPRGDDVIEAILAENLPLPRARQRMVDEFEVRYIERVLALHGGNVTHAAASSGIARRYFNTIRARLGRERP
jgi:two-component system response regulator HydG